MTIQTQASYYVESSVVEIVHKRSDNEGDSNIYKYKKQMEYLFDRGYLNKHNLESKRIHKLVQMGVKKKRDLIIRVAVGGGVLRIRITAKNRLRGSIYTNRQKDKTPCLLESCCGNGGPNGPSKLAM